MPRYAPFSSTQWSINIIYKMPCNAVEKHIFISISPLHLFSMKKKKKGREKERRLQASLNSSNDEKPITSLVWLWFSEKLAIRLYFSTPFSIWFVVVVIIAGQAGFLYIIWLWAPSNPNQLVFCHFAVDGRLLWCAYSIVHECVVWLCLYITILVLQHLTWTCERICKKMHFARLHDLYYVGYTR